MKDLLLSVCCMLVLLIPWELYSVYTTHTIQDCSNTIGTELLPSITENDWENAKESFESISNNWDSYKKIAVYFLSTDALNEVDSTISDGGRFQCLRRSVIPPVPAPVSGRESEAYPGQYPVVFCKDCSAAGGFAEKRALPHPENSEHP